MINYKGHNLSKGSVAADLYERKDFAKLDKHLREVDNAFLKLHGGQIPSHLVNYKIGQDTGRESV